MKPRDGEHRRTSQTNDGPDQAVAGSAGAHSDKANTEGNQQKAHTGLDSPTVNLPLSFDIVAVLVMLATFGSVYFACHSVQLATDTMKLDQRAWIAPVTFQTVPQIAVVGQVLEVQVVFKNIGRTPARRVVGHAVVEPVPAKTKPTFRYQNDPHFSVGLMQPNADHIATMSPVRSRSTGEARPVIEPILEVLKNGTIRLYVHGELTYDDIFQTPHWLQFCVYLSETLSSWPTCDEHNDTDNNR